MRWQVVTQRVVRTVDDHDRRVRRISLTAARRRDHRRLETVAARVDHDLTAVLTDDDDPTRLDVTSLF